MPEESEKTTREYLERKRAWDRSYYQEISHTAYNSYIPEGSDTDNLTEELSDAMEQKHK